MSYRTCILDANDYEYCVQKIKDSDWNDRYPHNFWNDVKDGNHLLSIRFKDAVSKWATLILRLESYLKESKDKKTVVDLGCGPCPIIDLVHDMGHEALGVDFIGHADTPHPLEGVLPAKRINKEGFAYLEEAEDDSVDVFIDGCAITHFSEIPVKLSECQWDKMFKMSKRVLKDGGMFFIASDVSNIPYDKKMIETNQYLAEFVPVDYIISRAEKYGFELQGEMENSFDDGLPGLGVHNFIKSSVLTFKNNKGE